MEKIDIKVEGMTCTHCEIAVVNALDDIGVKASASHQNNIVSVQFDPEKISLDKIKSEITDAGYKAS